jgi:hypothetical protein
LYEGLLFDADVQLEVLEYRGSDYPSDMGRTEISVAGAESIRRDGRWNICNRNWRLSEQETAFIRKRVEPVVGKFYVDEK